METMLPDYAGGSIANLMRTLADACGARALLQPPLDARHGLDSRQLSRARNIVLLVVDGLGAGTLERWGTGALRRHAGMPLTSVFPSTTASAIPTFMTGLCPAQHALTGWHMWLDELQAVTAVLPLKPRGKQAFPTPANQLPPRLFDHSPIYGAMHRPAWVLSPQEIAGSPFNTWHTRGADTLAYADLDAMMQMLGGLLQMPGRKFIYAYWPTLDSVSHAFGCASKEARETLTRFCAAFDGLVETAQGSDTRLLVTADHGFIDAPASRVIPLADHPELGQLLARPLCGEQRVAWCYLKPGAAADFMRYVSTRLGDSMKAIPSSDLLAQGMFGPGTPHPKLAARIGDFALIMKENWVIRDQLPGESEHSPLGQHGGTSRDEMLVPLVSLAL